MAWRGLLARLAPGSSAAAAAALVGRGAGHPGAVATTTTTVAARLAAARGLSTSAVSEAAGSHHVDEPLEDVPRCVGVGVWGLTCI